MNPLSRLFALLAPHNCINCNAEGALLCVWCRSSIAHVPSRCYGCLKMQANGATCVGCRRAQPLDAVVVRTLYEAEPIKKLIWRLKFDRAQSAAGEMADMLAPLLHRLPPETLITHVPTANARVRSRGYDQARLIAKHIARQRRLPYHRLLGRHGKADQIGANRKARQEQLAGAFYIANPRHVRGKTVLLVDDIMTTGATLNSAARLLKQNGAARVMAAVFAYAPLPSGTE